MKAPSLIINLVQNLLVKLKSLRVAQTSRTRSRGQYYGTQELLEHNVVRRQQLNFDNNYQFVYVIRLKFLSTNRQ